MILVVAIEPPHQRESEHYDPLDEVDMKKPRTGVTMETETIPR